MARRRLSSEEYVDGVCAGDRRVLARAITLVESASPDDADQAEDVLQTLLPRFGSAARIGITGVPGVGKSTLIETLGMQLVADGKRVAVLAIDPSSSVTGGSILGDKTRMSELARSDAAFIRPTPGGSALGGVAHHTREAVLLCEAAGFDVVLVETIGVGQSEIAVAEMVDFFLLLMLAGAGDGLQGIKRGILELADGVLLTKADGDGAARAEGAATELRSALAILRGPRADTAFVATCSARTGDGLDDAWRRIEATLRTAREDGTLAARRSEQDLAWFERTAAELVRERFLAQPSVVAELGALRDAVLNGTVAPSTAARRLVKAGFC